MKEVNIKNLDKETLDEIINAGLEVFSKNTYIKASVNNIVDKTRISKGSFFNYFGDKFNFFCYLYDFAIKTLNQDFINKVDITTSDFFERMKKTSVLKMEIAYKYPKLSDFLIKAYYEQDETVRAYVVDYNTKYMNQNANAIYQGIDTSSFRDGIDIPKIMEIITYISEGIVKKHEGRNSSYPEMVKEFDETMELIKPCFYKEK